MIAVSGYLLAAAYGRHFQFKTLLGLMVGITLVIASACVFNNYLDRNLDKKMARTKRRALASGKISPAAALAYGLLLGVLGFLTLVLLTNPTVVWLDAIAYFVYIVVYDIAKRLSAFGTLVGTIPGAIPPVAGYAALNRLDGAALLLFVIMVFWQLAHFYAIALYRQKEYAAAAVPVMPIRYGAAATKYQIMASIVLFTASGLGLWILGYTGVIFAVLLLSLSVYWFRSGLIDRRDEAAWGRAMFLKSLLLLVSLAVLLPLGALLP